MKDRGINRGGAAAVAHGRAACHPAPLTGVTARRTAEPEQSTAQSGKSGERRRNRRPARLVGASGVNGCGRSDGRRKPKLQDGGRPGRFRGGCHSLCPSRHSGLVVGRAILSWGPLWGRLSGGSFGQCASLRIRQPPAESGPEGTPQTGLAAPHGGKPQTEHHAAARRKNAPTNGAMAAWKATLRCCDEFD
jgi:hypothetical protein